MSTESDTIEVSLTDRRILGAALASLEREFSRNGNGEPMRENIDRLKKAVAGKVPSLTGPSHIDVQQANYLGLMTMLPAANSWRLYWEPVQGGLDHALVAELTLDDGDSRFEVARNLRGTGRFLELEPADLEFCRLIEKRMRIEGWNSAQIIHEVIEIPLPWDFLPDEDVIDRIERYLDSVREPGDYPPAIHSTLVDIHSNPEVADRGFAGVLAEVSGYEDEVEDARSLAERVTGMILSAPSLTR